MKGFGSEGSVLNLMLTAFIIWHVFVKPKLMKKQGKDRRKIGNPNDKPGNAVECKEHAKTLSRLETQFANFKEWLERVEKNNRKDHKYIFDKIDRIRNNR
jgi:hypothetical protein